MLSCFGYWFQNDFCILYFVATATHVTTVTIVTTVTTVTQVGRQVVDMFWLPSDTLKVTFSETPHDGQTDQQKTRLLELLRAAKNP